MSKKIILLLGFGILLLATIPGVSQTLKLPYKDAGACPFECCTYRDWFANKPISAFKSMSLRSGIAFKLKKGEKVRGLTGIVITSVAGKVKALRNHTFEDSKIKVKKGDTLLILTYLGEGYFRFWYKGKFFEEDANTDAINILSQPRSVWWVKLRNKNGKIGWAISDGNFDNQDQCG